MRILDSAIAARFAQMALDCVHREYPNKIAHVMTGDQDVRPPRELTPAFYGCFDWHSAVHNHWLLARLARLYPNEPFAKEARAWLKRNITDEHIAAECYYLHERPGFERPYGLAWLLTLGAELRLSSEYLAAVMLPLERLAIKHLMDWLPKLSRPDRSGQHFNTAFSLGLAWDAGFLELTSLIYGRALDFYVGDRNAPIAWEPSGEDFLSPSLAEADLMRRVLPPGDFKEWLDQFLPNPSALQPVASSDPTDGKLAHFDGLNLSRAWMLSALGFQELAESHAAAGLGAVTGEHYEGTHWLPTFAVYYLTQNESGHRRAP